MEGPISDGMLVHRAQGGDAEAFRMLYERHRPSVERVCRRWLRDPSTIDDAVQETFLKAWRALPGFQADGAAGVGPWLRRIARNHCHDVWRAWAQVELATLEGGYAEPADPTSMHLASDCADRLALQSVLQNLDRRDAALLLQRHVAEEPVGDMAREWGLTRASMDVALHRARVRARSLASAEGLRSLLPVGLIRRLQSFLQRLCEVPPEVAAALGGVAQIAVVASLVLQPLQPAYAEPRSAPPRVSWAQARAAETQDAGSPAVQRRADRAVAVDRSNQTPRSSADRGATDSPTVATAGDQPTPPSPAVRTIRYEPVQVPATGSRVEQRPPDAPLDRRAGVGGSGVPLIEVEVYELEPEPARPAANLACEGVNVADPVAYCDS